jgi:AraC-like DNA-binding protein
MKKSDCPYEPHLTIREFFLPPGEQWVPQLAGWSLIQVSQGTGYYLQPQLNQALEVGSVLLVAENVEGTIRASQLGGLSLCSFNVIPSRLTGLITLSEQDFLETASRREVCPQVFPPDSPTALKIGELYASRNRSGLLFRLKLLQILVETFGNGLEQIISDREISDARDRLQALLKQTPSSELLQMDLDELAQVTRCTPRHLNRIFHKLVGMSFRDKRTDLRLARALELLATTNSKVVEVALESGYKSLSLFNLVFVRRFGISPGKWRQKQGNNKDIEKSRSKRTKQLVPAENSVHAFRGNFSTRFAGNPTANKSPFKKEADKIVTKISIGRPAFLHQA